MMRNSAMGFMAAVGVVLTSGAGFAEEKVVPVTFTAKIYGQLHVSVDSIDNGATRNLYLSSNSSRLGFKGESAMSDVLKAKAIWQIEGFLALDEKDVNTIFVQRNTFVGVDTTAGAVLAGRYDTPFKCLVSKIDQFNDRIGDAANITGPGGKTWDQRPDNTITYRSPSIAGVTLTGAYIAEEELPQSEQVSGSVLWENSNYFVGAGYERHGKLLTGSTNASGVVAIPSAEAEEGYRAIAGGSCSNGSVAVMVQKLVNVGGKGGADAVVYGGAVACKAGACIVKAQCLVRNDTGVGKGATMVALGVDHNFSSQITAYVAGVKVLNGDGSSYRMSGDGHGESVAPAATGKDSVGVGLGVIYKF